MLVLFFCKLFENNLKASNGVMNLSNHRDQLTNNNATIEGIFYVRKMLFKNMNGRFIHHEITIAPVIIVKQNSCSYFLSYYCWNFCYFLSFNLNSFNCLNELSLFVIKADIDSLFTMDFIRELLRRLDDFK